MYRYFDVTSEEELLKSGKDHTNRLNALPHFMALWNHESSVSGTQPLDVTAALDALSDHLSNLHSTIEAGENAENYNDKLTHHGRRVCQIMDLLQRAHNANPDLVNLSIPADPEMWMQKHVPDAQEGETQGKLRGAGGFARWRDNAFNYKNIFASPPHKSFANTIHQNDEPHNTGYPFHLIKVNGYHPTIDCKTKYNPNISESTHPFDKHPLMSGGGTPYEKVHKYMSSIIDPDSSYHKDIKNLLINNRFARHSTEPSSPMFHPSTHGSLEKDGSITYPKPKET